MGSRHDVDMAANERFSSPEDRWVSTPASSLIVRLRALASTTRGTVIIGIDGRGGSGKSTLADEISKGLSAEDGDPAAVTVIEGDQFYAGGSNESWDGRTAAAKADEAIDWRKQRGVLQRLREGCSAEWHPFDWVAEDWDSDVVPLAAEPVIAHPASVVVLEGAYSCRPELHDLLDLRVLLDVPHETRRRQLLEREGDDYRADWEARWAAAEDHYFGTVMRADRFDIVLGLP